MCKYTVGYECILDFWIEIHHWHLKSNDESALTYSTIGLRVSRVRIPAAGPFPILPPSLAPTFLPVSSTLSYHNNIKNKKAKRSPLTWLNITCSQKNHVLKASSATAWVMTTLQQITWALLTQGKSSLKNIIGLML